MLQWGSETGSRRRTRTIPLQLLDPLAERFNGAPRLGLGEGARLAAMGIGPDLASMGLRDWVSEKGSGRVRAAAVGARFNGAPRLGLGEGSVNWSSALWLRTLQWGSETGSRRRYGILKGRVMESRASMGLRDWVSEKASGGCAC